MLTHVVGLCSSMYLSPSSSGNGQRRAVELDTALSGLGFDELDSILLPYWDAARPLGRADKWEAYASLILSQASMTTQSMDEG